MENEKDKRIFIKCVKPTICKRQMADITEYHDGNYDIDVYCGLSKERIKCEQSTCKKKEYSGIPYDTAIKKMARAICKAEDDDSGCSMYCDDKCKCKNLKYSQLAEAALNALLEE